MCNVDQLKVSHELYNINNDKLSIVTIWNTSVFIFILISSIIIDKFDHMSCLIVSNWGLIVYYGIGTSWSDAFASISFSGTGNYRKLIIYGLFDENPSFLLLFLAKVKLNNVVEGWSYGKYVEDLMRTSIRNHMKSSLYFGIQLFE